MAHAKVFVTVLLQDRAAEDAEALKALAPEIRYRLARAMRITPRAGTAFPLRRVDGSRRAHRPPPRCATCAPVTIPAPNPSAPPFRGQKRERDGVPPARRHPAAGQTAGCRRTRPCSACAICSAPTRAGIPVSLDPLATGLLPVCFGEATKIAGGLLGARARPTRPWRRLGIVTDTDDAEGHRCRERPVPAITIDTHRRGVEVSSPAASASVPPIYSAPQARRRTAVREGAARRDHRKSRNAGRRPRLRPGERRRPAGRRRTAAMRLHVECGSGTYVRSLVRDLGELLGCGAHVAELRRLWVDPFREPRMWTLEALENPAGAGRRARAGGPPAADRGGNDLVAAGPGRRGAGAAAGAAARALAYQPQGQVRPAG